MTIGNRVISYALFVFSLLIINHANAQNIDTIKVLPSAVIIGKNQPRSLTIRLESSQEIASNKLKFCIEFNSECHTLSEERSKFKLKHNAKQDLTRNLLLEYEDLILPKSLISKLNTVLKGKAQGESLEFKLNAIDPVGNIVISTPFFVYPALSSESLISRREVHNQTKRENKGKKSSKKKNGRYEVGSRSTSSFNYRSPAGTPVNECSGTNFVYNSYKAFLNCTDAAIVNCNQSDSYDKAICIYDTCGNTPDLFEGLWRDIDGGTSDSGTQSVIQNGVGSSAIGDTKFQIQLHPCLLDGAALLNNSFASFATLMNKSYPLMSSFFEVFHPARPDNLNLSRGRIRISFNDKTIISLKTENFGETTVPYTYYQELFKSLERTAETQDQIFWIKDVIPVLMYFRPQGVFGFQLQTRVSSASRILEINSSSYVDFGTSSGAGPARDQVQKIRNEGIVSLIQSDLKTTKYLSLSADDLGMRPSLSDLVELEYWPPRGAFKPVCAQWFADGSTNPNRQAYQCDTLVDFGGFSSRVGAIRTIRDGTERIIEYRDPSDEEDEEPGRQPGDSELPDNRYFPYRSPILDDF